MRSDAAVRLVTAAAALSMRSVLLIILIGSVLHHRSTITTADQQYPISSSSSSRGETSSWDVEDLDELDDGEREAAMYMDDEWDDVIRSSLTSVPCAERKQCNTPQREHLTYAEQNCFCDDMCVMFDDCCEDYVASTSGTPSPSSSSSAASSSSSSSASSASPISSMHEDVGGGLDGAGSSIRSTTSCERVESIDHRVEINIVTSCPKQYRDEAVRLRCEERMYGDTFFDTPVTGVASKLLYKNMFCAQCGGEVNITFWNLRVGCGETPVLNDTMVSRTGRQGQYYHALVDHVMTGDHRDQYFCNVEYFHPHYRPRHCKSNLGRCNRNWSDKRTKRRCRSHTAYVYAGKEVFKNEACALCNYVNQSYTSCEDTRSPRFNSNNMWDTAAPFSITVDPNRGSATVMSASGNQNAGGSSAEPLETFVAMAQCGVFEVYDPFSKRCRQVMCVDPTVSPICEITTTTTTTTRLPTTTATATTAQPKTTSTAKTTTPSWTQNEAVAVEIDDNPDEHYGGVQTDLDNCHLRMLNESDYIMYDSNRTIYVHSTKQWLGPTQYERIGIYVAICIDAPPAPLYMFQFTDTQKMVSFICLVISLVCLFVLFVLHLLLRPLRTTSGCSIMSLCFALFGAQATFLLGVHTAQSTVACFAMAIAMHYAFLVSFFWMNVLAMDMLRIATTAAANAVNINTNGLINGANNHHGSDISISNGKSCRFVCYSFYAWLIPGLIVGISTCLEYVDIAPSFRPHYGRKHLCWSTSRNNLLYFLALPLALLLAVNIVLFICTLRRMFTRKRTIHRHMSVNQKVMGGVQYRPGVQNAAQDHKIRDRGRLTFYIQYSFVVGLTWIFAFLCSFIPKYGYLWYAFIGLTALQSFLLCVACLCNKRTLRILRGGGRVHRRSPNTPTRYSSGARTTNGKHLFYHYDEDEEVVGAQETSI